MLALTSGCLPSHTQSKPPEKSFLWEVHSEASTVYILGSIHAARPELYPLAEPIENAFGRAENIAVEFDVTTTDEAHLATLMIQKAKYPQGETLYSNIPEELYEKTDELLEDLGADVLLFNSYEPWAVAMEIEALQLLQYGYLPEYGIDMYFLDRAHEEGKDIHELESARFQINLLDEFPPELQIFMLESVVTDPLTRKDLEQIFECWEEGDTTGMEQLALEMDDDDPRIDLLNEKLLDERNFEMAEKINQFLNDDEDYFVVVGAAHLVGENGIINLLEEEGYEITQL